MRTLFVCTGNINRSAVAGAIGASPSAGTSINARKGMPMSKAMRTMMDHHPLAEAHRSRYIGDMDLTGCECIVGFQPSHVRAAEALCQQLNLGALCVNILDLVPHPHWRTRVPDPAFDRHMMVPVFGYIAMAVERMK